MIKFLAYTLIKICNGIITTRVFVKKVSTNLWLLSKICNFLGRDHRLMYYKAYIQPHLNYCNIIWGNSSNNNVSRITRLQKRACRLILQDEYTDFDNAKSTLKMLAFEESVS